VGAADPEPRLAAPDQAAAQRRPHAARGRYANVWLGATVEDQARAHRIDELADSGHEVPVRFVSAEPLLGPLELGGRLRRLQWLIVGGESGGGARPFHVGWARSLVAECRAAEVAAFVKQLGADPRDGGRVRLPLYEDAKKGGSLEDFPPDLRLREMPAAWRGGRA
jgi:protein gp37